MISYLVLLGLFVAVILLIARTSRHRRGDVQNETERVARETLPMIGGVAERAHYKRFGTSPDSVPPVSAGTRLRPTSWYPETKRMAKHRT